jgi:hypothetical protein
MNCKCANEASVPEETDGADVYDFKVEALRYPGRRADLFELAR